MTFWVKWCDMDMKVCVMERRLSIPVGVVVVREDADNPWQDYIWRLGGVVLGAQDETGWHELERDDGFVRYFAGVLDLKVFRKETEAYQVNLNNKVPVVYVVMREASEPDAAVPIEVHLVTVSAFEAQDYLDSGEEIVDTAPMPDTLIAWVQRFVDRHHVDEKFVKRKRDEVRMEDHKFGKDPIFVRAGRERSRDN
ncbi:MAG: DUF3305 domain-containing protein [Hyphomicrobiaceae bacterium]